MQSLKDAGKIHPLIAVAAASVIIVSLVGVAAMTGMLPSSDSTTKPTSAIEAAPPVTEKQASPAHHAKPATTAVKSPSSTTVSRASEAATVRHACDNCGSVIGVRTIEQAAKPSGIGVVAGAVVGGVLGNQVGGGTGKTLATVAGAVGGGYAGNEIEKRTRKATTYEVDVKMEDGESRSFPFEAQPGWAAGDKVRVVNGTLEPR